ncbi:ubiquinol-cytochrome-c reductase complex assembly factor 1-like protein [Tanacetum coccineum]
MMNRWSRSIANIYKQTHHKSSSVVHNKDLFVLRSISRVAAAHVPPVSSDKPEVNLNKLFRSKPCSLTLPPDSPLRIEEPTYEGLRHFLLKMMLFYSKQSKSIRQANVIYRRVVYQVDKPAIYDVFSLEKTFRTNFSMLVVHMWLCLRRLKAEGKEGIELGQYVYEIYNHDLEERVSKAGVNLLLSKWMRELEKVFYGNIVAFDTAMLPEAKPDDLQTAIWKFKVLHVSVRPLLILGSHGLFRAFHEQLGSFPPLDLTLGHSHRDRQTLSEFRSGTSDPIRGADLQHKQGMHVHTLNVFAEDGSSKLDAAALPAVMAFTRYVRRECTCLSLTDKEAMMSGNFLFTPIENLKA